MDKIFGKKKEQIVEDASRWFRIFVKMPLIMLFITLGVSFVLGVIAAIMMGKILGFGYGIGIFCVIWLSGALIGLLYYILMKLILSHKVLHLHMLEEILEKTENEKV